MRSRFSSWSINQKTLVSHALLALLVVLIMSVVAYTLGFRYVRSSSIEALLDDAKAIASFEAPRTDQLTPPNKRELERYEQLTNARVFIIDTSLVAMHAPLTAPMSTDEVTQELSRTAIMDSIDKQFITRVLNGEAVTDIRRFEFAGGIIVFAGAPIYNAAGAVIGGAVLAQPVARLNELSAILRALLLLTSAAAIIVAALVSIWLARLLTSPINSITHVARRMSEGEYGVRVAIESTDEIGELGSTLNALSSRLGEYIERLREERDKLELIISGIGEGIVAVDANCNAVHNNQSFLGLLEAREDFKLSQHSVLSDTLKRCMELGERVTAQFANASERNLMISASPIADIKGDITGAVALIRDVSEAERLEKLRRDYIANISHELRTPLTGIRGMVEPLLDGYIDTDAERMECYRIIYQETLRLEKLVSEMLDMSRLQDGRLKPELERLEVSGIIEAAVRRMRNNAQDAGIDLSFDTGGSLLNCMGDENRILQVLIILLDNALSFTPAGGKVLVSAKEDAELVRISVIDNGVGIQPKDLPFIWERFFKVDRSRLRTSGTGLGLAIAKLVVELMGGEIGVISKAGEGSEFYFTLKK